MIKNIASPLLTAAKINEGALHSIILRKKYKQR